MKNKKKKPSAAQNRPRTKRSIRILWGLFFFGVFTVCFLIVSANFGLLGYMPSMKELENPSSSLSSEVYGSDGTLITRYYVQDRSNSRYEEISPNIIEALLATEDIRFFEHSGIDPIATMAIPAYILTGKRRGSSTITQQLAKNLFPRESSSMLAMPFIKLKEWVMAVKLERNLTKNEIITLYLNTVPFSDNVFGIKNASLTFYQKLPSEVSVDEAAILVGMLKGNTLYNPRRNPKIAMERRNLILTQMADHGFLKKEESESYKALPIKLRYKKIDHHDGLAPYFRQVLEGELKAMLKDLKKEDGSPYNLYKDGLKIYTTIDVKMQAYAEQAVAEHLTEMQALFKAQPDYLTGRVWNTHKKYLNEAIRDNRRYRQLKKEGLDHEDIIKEMSEPVDMKVFAWNEQRSIDTVMSPIDSIKYMKMFLQAGFMAMDPFTGEVKAWVGGIDHTFFQYDHVNKGTKRQVGSTIKPLLYCLAVDNGFSPCGYVSTLPQSFPEKEHYDAGGSKYVEMPMNLALAKSVNNAALYIIKQVGVNAFVHFAHRCGIESKLEKFPSIALGASDISLIEMVSSYSMFPAQGMRVSPLYLLKIEDKEGNILRSFSTKQQEIINENTAYKMVRMMQGVVDQGTGRRLRYRYGLNGEIAGKTGTTNSQADAWFIGYTPQILAGVWVGCDDRYLRFSSERLGQGAAAALPIWALFMKKLYADKEIDISPEAQFERPEYFDDCQVIDPTSLQRSGYPGSYSPYNDSSDPIEEIPISEWGR